MTSVSFLDPIPQKPELSVGNLGLDHAKEVDMVTLSGPLDTILALGIGAEVSHNLGNHARGSYHCLIHYPQNHEKWL